MVSTRLVKSKETRSRAELADFLEHLASRVREGNLLFHQGAEDLAVALPEALRVDVEVVDSVKPSRRKRELEIEIWWEIDEGGAPVETPSRPGGAVLA